MEAKCVRVPRCEVTRGTPGSHRQAVCLGSALNVSAQ
ncbi:Rcs stress response system protein RcsF, partial [Staphylococcus aureus]|nr:Rcs stress response system protein RcsF [Staphylococcus aureus]